MILCTHCNEPLSNGEISHGHEHPGLCCNCFDLSCGMPIELLNKERAATGRPPIAKPWGAK